MLVFDLMFLKTFKLTERIKNDSSDAKWSSVLFIGIYIACSIIIIISTLGLLNENAISSLFKKNAIMLWMIAFILSPILVGIRYYRLKSVEEIEDRYNKINKRLKKIANLITYSMFIGIPIFTFIVFRLFVIGRIEWW
jgi:uncharacterized membrane-anchored protein